MHKTINDKAREYADDAIAVAADVMSNPTEETRDRLRAAEMILDRAYGKAAQAVIAIPANRAARQLAAQYSDEQLDNIIEGEIIRKEQEALPAPIDPLLE